MVKEFIEDSRVKLATAVACIIAVIAYVRYDTAWRISVDAKIQRLAETIESVDSKIVGKTPDGWHRRDMLRYSVEAERKNENWTAPEVKWE